MTYSHLHLIKKISPFFTLLVDWLEIEFSLSPEEQQVVDRIWQEQLNKKDRMLFNSKMLVFSTLSEERMAGRFIDYKYYLAQLVEPALRQVLHIQPITISGMTTVGEKVLYGRRSGGVTEYPQHFELVPSGGIDPHHENEGVIDIEAQLLSELEQEAGIEKKNVQSVSPWALVFDTQKEIFEICMSIKAKPEAIEQTRPFSAEYESLSWISKKALRKKR